MIEEGPKDDVEAWMMLNGIVKVQRISKSEFAKLYVDAIADLATENAVLKSELQQLKKPTPAHQVNGLSAWELDRLGISLPQYPPTTQGKPMGTNGFPFRLPTK